MAAGVIYRVPPVVSAAVKDFQSIQDIQVDFGRFTVLVGPSNSGKSAFLRAVRACLRNTFVPANVRAGATKSVVLVQLDGAEPVTIERGKSLSTYKLGEEAFTKAARTVPEPVARAIAMPLLEGSDLNFSFQFDRPFLLAETGSQAAQVIGSLTNVTKLHEAVREANRRRSEANQTLRIRRADVERFAAQAADYADLPAEQRTLQRLSADLVSLEARQAELTELQGHLDRIREAKQRLDRVEIPPEPVDRIARIEELGQSLSELDADRRTLAVLRHRDAEIRQHVLSALQARTDAEQAEETYRQTLHEIGVCPLCEQEVAA